MHRLIAWIKTFLRSTFFRFLLMGGTNVVVLYLIYRLFLLITDYQTAYTLAYLIAIFTAYLLNSFFSFRQPFSWRKLCRYPIVYVTQFVLSLGLVELEVRGGIDERYAPAIAIILLIPLSYYMNKKILTGQHVAPL